MDLAETQQDLISIIIPIFNAQKFLAYCLETVTNQTHTNLEIILIDDGSTDKSGAICETYAKYDKRITVVYQKNAGVSAARNEGLRLATGKYIAFVDADDYVHFDAYRQMHTLLKREDADICIGGYKLSFAFRMEHVQKPFANPSVHVLQNVQTQRGLFSRKSFYYSTVWNKLYKKELFDGIHFPVDTLFEDEYVTPLLLGKAQKIIAMQDVFYYYFQHEEGISAKMDGTKVLDILHGKQMQMEYFKTYAQGQLYPAALYGYLISLLHTYSALLKYEKDKPKAKKYLALFRENVKDKSLLLGLPLHTQLRLRFAAMFPFSVRVRYVMRNITKYCYEWYLKNM